MTEIETTVTTTEPAEPAPVEAEPVPVEVEPVAEVEPVEVEPPTPAPKRRGRPVGAKSKEPGKPRAPRKAKVVEPVEEEIPERILPGSIPIPTHGYDNRAAMMLEMLQLQADERRRRKSELYRSWFRQ